MSERNRCTVKWSILGDGSLVWRCNRYILTPSPLDQGVERCYDHRCPGRRNIVLNGVEMSENKVLLGLSSGSSVVGDLSGDKGRSSVVGDLSGDKRICENPGCGKEAMKGRKYCSDLCMRRKYEKGRKRNRKGRSTISEVGKVEVVEKTNTPNPNKTETPKVGLSNKVGVSKGILEYDAKKYGEVILFIEGEASRLGLESFEIVRRGISLYKMLKAR